MRVVVLGIGNMGKFHIREFLSLGCEISAVLERDKESCERAAEELADSFNIHPKAYSDLKELLEKEKPDAASICTPPEYHQEQIRQCLNSRVNVICEKPIVQTDNNIRSVKELLELAEENKKILTMNTQWPSVLRYVQDLIDLGDIREFSILMEPGKKGEEMLLDHLPHTNSLLVHLVPGGKAENINFPVNEQEHVIIEFDYPNSKTKCKVRYELKYKAERPRKISFSINGNEFWREMGKDYSQKIVSKDMSIDIEDPLRASLRKFIESIQGKNSPLITSKEILENISLQELIFKAHNKLNN